jgi:DNA-binding protein H-NS
MPNAAREIVQLRMHWLFWRSFPFPTGAQEMPKSLAKIEKEIEALEREAEALRKKEAAGVIARIKEAIAHYHLSAQDLGLAGEPRGRRGVARGSRRIRPDGKPLSNGAAAKRIGARRSPAGQVQFKDDTGNTWSGRGRRPDWLKAALQNGKTLDDLRA